MFYREHKTLGKIKLGNRKSAVDGGFAECQTGRHSATKHASPSAAHLALGKHMIFAECLLFGTRQRHDLHRVPEHLHSAMAKSSLSASVFILGKLVSRRHLMVTLPSAIVNALGKVTISFFFACFLLFTIPKHSNIKYNTIYTLHEVIKTYI